MTAQRQKGWFSAVFRHTLQKQVGLQGEYARFNYRNGCFSCACRYRMSQQSGSSASINNILISEFTGRVEITQSGDGITSFELSSAPAPQPQSAEFVDGALIVVGEAYPKDFDIDNALNWRLHKQRAFSKYLDDFGSLKIAATENCNIRFLNSYAEISVTAANASVAIDDGWIEGAIGNVQNADIDIKTHGKIKIGNVEDRLRVKAGGASTIDAGSAGSAELMIGGSGKVSTLNIAGDAITRVNGSGDIRLGSIAGYLDASIAGSGDIQTGPVLGGATYSIAGSGDIESQTSLARQAPILRETGTSRFVTAAPKICASQFLALVILNLAAPRPISMRLSRGLARSPWRTQKGKWS